MDEELLHFVQRTSEFYKTEGCTKGQIISLMKKQEVDRLPKMYVDIMELIGNRGIDMILLLECCTYANVIIGGERSIIIANNPTLAARKIFIFAYTNDIYVFFETNNSSDDPPVYVYKDDENNDIRMISESLSDYIWGNIKKTIIH